ncbi:MAG: hypothetical protein P0Y65_05385 [Candidatus Devosia phytovorans]|uniref:Uncharacterized protein n=1 Tax=Candidatus Devosia phytovorans TaxID=3121372 RepID=A0AAJ5VY67_9HYPH|nr:hypothetical protein [Devosia sp.]WEK05688.1 MAG: hypothetical protein P0Y65_05385 [Devosia sp.]
MDKFEGREPSDTGPALDGFAITPSDTQDLRDLTRALYVGGGGDVRVEMAWGTAITLKSVPAGTILPLRARKVLAATTASFLVGLL